MFRYPAVGGPTVCVGSSKETLDLKRETPPPFEIATLQENIKDSKGAKGGKVSRTGLIKSMNHPVLGLLKVTYATKKSYICSVDPDSNKPKLFLEVTDTATPDHATVIESI